MFNEKKLGGIGKLSMEVIKATGSRNRSEVSKEMARITTLATAVIYSLDDRDEVKIINISKGTTLSCFRYIGRPT